MLRLRRTELRSRIDADEARLRQVEARLRIIETEGTMPSEDIQVKALPAVRVAHADGGCCRLRAGLDQPGHPAPVRPALRRPGQGRRADGRPGLWPGTSDAAGRRLWLVHAGMPVEAEPGVD